jgi:predicted ester cyclase
MIVMMHEGSPDMKTEIKAIAVDGNLLIAYGTTKGTNSGPMMGMPATNKSWSYDFADVIKFDDNMKMSEHWGVYDQFKMMRDLGMIPPPPAMDKKEMKM